MTKLTKPVTRGVVILTDHRITPREQDNIAVTLYPCGDIGFRAKRSRKVYRLPLAVAYTMAVKAEALAAKKAQKKKAGKP